MIDQFALNYPIVMIGSGYFSICMTSDELTRCSSSALTRKVYERASFTDSDGNQFKVLSVRKKGYVPPFWGFRLLRGRQVNVDLELSQIGSLTLSDLIDVVRKSLNSSSWGASPEFFAEILSESKTIGEFLTRLNA